MEFKERLKALRKENKLTQSTLGSILNYGYTAISNYESGRNEPSITDLKKIAEYFDVSMDYLLCVNDVRNPYVERDYPAQFDEFKNVYIRLNETKQDTLNDFIQWLSDKQNKENSETKKNLMVAKNPPVYKTKNN